MRLSSVVISCIAVIEGARDQLAWASMAVIMGKTGLDGRFDGLGVHDRTLVNSWSSEFWG